MTLVHYFNKIGEKSLNFIYVFIFGCTGSLLLCGAALHCGVPAFHRGGVSYGAQALEYRLSRCGACPLVAPQHLEYSQTTDRTCVPCIIRQILIHCTTKEVLKRFFFFFEEGMCISFHVGKYCLTEQKQGQK